MPAGRPRPCPPLSASHPPSHTSSRPVPRFECKSDGEYFTVLHASLEPADGDVEDSAYTGPVYEELDEKLQASFQQYLAERGVDEALGAYVLPLIHDKEQREYVRWLANVQAFLRK
jgi:hypothetical protein